MGVDFDLDIDTNADTDMEKKTRNMDISGPFLYICLSPFMSIYCADLSIKITVYI
jgi:hypothetical protein